MLGILLTILKVLLLIIVGLLALVLLVALIVLYAPVHYKIDAKYKDQIDANFRLRYLFFTVDVFYDKVEQGIKYVVKAAGIKIKLGEEREAAILAKEQKKLKKQQLKESKKNKKRNIDDVADDIKEENVLVQPNEADENILLDEPEKDTEDIKAIEATEETSSEKSLEELDEYDDLGEYDEFEDLDDIPRIEEDINFDEEENTGFRAKVTELLEKVKQFFIKVSEFMKKLSPENIEQEVTKKLKQLERKKKILERKYKLIKKFIEYPPTQKSWKYLKKYIPKTLKHIAPRKVKGYIHYGLGDPFNTGRVTGYLSMMPFMYHKKLSIQPDFYEKVIDFDIHMKGYLLIGYVIRIALRKEIWQTYRAWTKVKEKLDQAK